MWPDEPAGGVGVTAADRRLIGRTIGGLREQIIRASGVAFHSQPLAACLPDFLVQWKTARDGFASRPIATDHALLESVHGSGHDFARFRSTEIHRRVLDARFVIFRNSGASTIASKFS